MITYEAAMATLKTMFPEADESVTTMVLEANGGHMERTVEQLLGMQIPQASDAPKGIPSQAAGKSDQSQLIPGKSLPDDFLRPPSYFKQASVSQQQVDQDAELARMLQDELFLQDLARNPEFYGLAPQQQGNRRSGEPAQQQQPARSSQTPGGPKPAAAAAAAPLPDSASDPAGADDSKDSSSDFREKFKSLGDTARRKLAALASKFGKSQNVRLPEEEEHYMSLPSLDDQMGGFDMGSIDDGEAIELQDQRYKNKDKDKAEEEEPDDL